MLATAAHSLSPNPPSRPRRLLFLKGYAMRFVIGQTDDQSAEEQLQREIAAYGPMLRLNITESYEGLAWKSHHYLLMVHRYFDADYVVKIDDDVYLRFGAPAAPRWPACLHLPPHPISLGLAGPADRDAPRSGQAGPADACHQPVFGAET